MAEDYPYRSNYTEKSNLRNNFSTMGPESSLSFNFAPHTTVVTQIENFIRSDVCNRIIEEKVSRTLENPQIVERMLNSPATQEYLVKFFSSAQGSELVKKILAQNPELVPVPTTSQTSMSSDNRMQHAPRVSLLTWNVLAKSFAKPKFYGYCPQHILDINHRITHITKTIQNFKPDVFCLQEVEKQEHDFLASVMHEYQCTFANHPEKPDGCSLFIKRA